MRSQLNTFDWVAPVYDRLAKVVFGSTLLDAQLSFIDSIQDHDSILILGGGSGEFLETLLKRRPSVKICYIEASEKMLALSKGRTMKLGGVNFIHGTEDNIPNFEFNVVITNFFLDLFPDSELQTVVEKIDSHLLPGGKWIVTDFETSPRMGHRIMLSGMYFFFRIIGSIRATRLPDWRSLFKSKRLKVMNEKEFARGFVKSTVLFKTPGKP